MTEQALPFMLVLRNSTGEALHNWYCRDMVDVRGAFADFMCYLVPGDLITCETVDI